MNTDNMNALADWLGAGAPGAIFCVEVGICLPTDEDVQTNTEYLSLHQLLNETEQTDKDASACAHVVGVAGAAYLLMNAKNGRLPSVDMPIPPWPVVASEALEWLGTLAGYDLFGRDDEPGFCTVQQAAVAVRRVIAGKPAWSED